MVTRIPPYEYQWTWGSQEGSATSNALSASAANGAMSSGMHVTPASTEFASIDQICSVGIFFRPPTRNGFLPLSSTPSFNASYYIDGLFASLRTNSWIGLYVEQYNVSDNSFAGTVIDGRTDRVFNLDGFYFYEAGGIRYISNTGFPLSAMFPVDNSHCYSLWVQCGGHASGGGVLAFAGSSIDLTVGSITWSYASIS